MREIKFRAWDKLDNIMHYDPFIHNYDGYLNKEWFKLEYLVFQQYTGLKDKNGKDIYEGDIVKYKKIERLDDVSEEISEVKYGAGSFYPLPINEECEDNWYSIIITNYEVIGNIYENQELLKEKK